MTKLGSKVGFGKLDRMNGNLWTKIAAPNKKRFILKNRPKFCQKWSLTIEFT